MNIRRSFEVIAVALSVLLLSSCPAPITEQALLHIRDSLVPSIVIASPEDGSFCAKTVIVEGTVTDTSTAAGSVGEVRSLGYEILSTDVSEDVAFDESGAFTFSFETGSLGQTFVVRLTATDWNGNVGVASITLNVSPGDDITSFTATGGDRGVTLEWDPVPGTAQYDVYYTTNGTLPTDLYGELLSDVTSPYELGGLQNGSLCVFRLQAVSESTDDSWSDYEMAIPMSETTLAPRVYGEFGQNRIVWPEIPGSDSFLIYKSEDPNGTFDDLAGEFSGNEYVDTAVVQGTDYWYRIRPAQHTDTISLANVGTPCPFPDNRIVKTVFMDHARGVDVAGDYAYVADVANGVVVLDISDPYHPVTLTTVPLANVNSVTVDGNYLYATNYDDLTVIDIQNPATAAIVHTVDLTNSNDVFIAGGFAFVAAFDLQIVDIGDALTPTTAALKYTVDVSNPVNVTVDGDYAYVTDSLGLRIVDLTPLPASSPTIAYTVTTGITNASDVAVQNGYAYVTDFFAGVCVLDLSPLPGGAPSVDYTVPFSGSSVGLDVADGFVYVAAHDSGEKFTVLDTAPLPSGAPVRLFTANTGYASDVAVAGRYAYVADEQGGLRIIDISTPVNPTLLTTVPIDTSDVAIAGDYCYAGNADIAVYGLTVVDISDPGSASEIIDLPLGGYPYALVQSGQSVFLGIEGEGLKVVDVSNPSAPVLSDTASANEGYDVEVFGSYAYVTDGTAGLRIVDFTDADATQIVQSVAASANSYYVAISGSYALVSTYGSLEVIDIRTPESASILQSVSGFTTAHGVDTSGQYAFVADGGSGLEVYDLSNLPTGVPALVRSTPLTSALAVAVSGDYAYVADQTDGLVILDLSPLPGAPAKVIRTIPATDPQNLRVSGNYLYLADRTGGLKVYELWPF